MVQQVSSKGALRWGLAASLALMAGCGAPATQATLKTSPAGRADLAVPAGASVRHVDIRPTGRHVQAASQGYRGWSYGSPSGFSASGTYPALATNAQGQSSLVVTNPKTKTATTATTPINGTVGALSRGGRFAAFNNGSNIGVYDLNTQLIRNFPQMSTANVGAFDVDGFGNVAYLDAQNQVNVFDVTTGQNFMVPTATRGTLPLTGVSIAGNGTSVATADAAGVYLTSLLTGTQVTVPFVGAAYGGGGLPDGGTFQLSPYGNQLLYSDVNANLRSVDLTTGFTDNLALLNSAGPAWGATFLGADTANILYTTPSGQVQAYNRISGLIDTMPIQNRINDTINSLIDYGGYGLW